MILRRQKPPTPDATLRSTMLAVALELEGVVSDDVLRRIGDTVYAAMVFNPMANAASGLSHNDMRHPSGFATIASIARTAHMPTSLALGASVTHAQSTAGWLVDMIEFLGAEKMEEVAKGLTKGPADPWSALQTILAGMRDSQERIALMLEALRTG